MKETDASQTTAGGGFIYSCIGGDPDLGDIVELFVQEIPHRAKALSGQLNARDWDGMRQTAHQLKGAASSYGFGPISRIAGTRRYAETAD